MKERYAVIAPLGSGAYGSVYKCLDRETGNLCALKVINLAHQEPVVMRLAMRELRTLQKLPQHPHIVELKDAFKSSGSGRVFLVFSCEGRSMHEEAENHARYILPGPMLRQVAWQLLQALVHLHDHRVIHRDVKPGNILLVGDGAGGVADIGRNGADVHIRLADFGFARSWQPHEALSSYVATRWFRAPEILVRGKYSYNSDCWSVGCTIGELAVGSALFPGTSTIDQLARIMRATGPLPPALAAQMMADRHLCPLAAQQRQPAKRTLRERLPVEARLFEFLSACLQVDPAKRPSAKELMQMPYFWDVMPRNRALPQPLPEAVAAARDAAVAQIAAAEAEVAKAAGRQSAAAAAMAEPADAAARRDSLTTKTQSTACQGAFAATGTSGSGGAAGGAVGQHTASSGVAAPMPTTPTASEAQTMSLSAVACSQADNNEPAAVAFTAAPAESTASATGPPTSLLVSVKAAAAGEHAARAAAAGGVQPKAPSLPASPSTGGLVTMSPAIVPTAASSQDGESEATVGQATPTAAVPSASAQASVELPPRVVCVRDLTTSTLPAGAVVAHVAQALGTADVAEAQDSPCPPSSNERALLPPQEPVTVVTSNSLLPAPMEPEPSPLPALVTMPVAVAVTSPFTLASAADIMGGGAAAGIPAAPVALGSGGEITPRSHTAARMLDLPSNTVEMFMSPTTSAALQRMLPAVMTPMGAPPMATPSAAARMRQLMPHCRAPAGGAPPALTYGMLSRGNTLDLDVPAGNAAPVAVATAAAASARGLGGSEDGYSVPGTSSTSCGQLQIQLQMQQHAAQRHAVAAAANRVWRRTGRASVELAPLKDRLAWSQASSQPDRAVSGAGTSMGTGARAIATGGATVSGGGTACSATRCTRHFTSAAIMRRSWRLLPYRTSSGLPSDVAASSVVGGSPGFVPVPSEEPAVQTPSLQVSGAAAVLASSNAAASLGRRNSRSQASFVRSVSRMSQCHATPSGALDAPAARRDSSVDGTCVSSSSYAIANGSTSSPLAGMVAAAQQQGKPQQPVQIQVQRNGSTVGGAVARTPQMLHGLVLPATGDSPSLTRRAASAVLPSFPAGSVIGNHATPATFAGDSGAGGASNSAASMVAPVAGSLRSPPQVQQPQQPHAIASPAGHMPYGHSRLANAASSALCDYPSGEAATPTVGATLAGATASAFASGTPTGAAATDSAAGRRMFMGGASWQTLQAIGCGNSINAAAAAACFDSAASATVATAQGAGTVSLDVMLAAGAGGCGTGAAEHSLANSASAMARYPSATLLAVGGGAVSGAYVPHVITEDEDELADAAAGESAAATAVASAAAGPGRRAGHLHDTADRCVRLADGKDIEPSCTQQHLDAGQPRVPSRLAPPGGKSRAARRPGLLARLFGCGRFDKDEV
ncbi:hypothetical protein HYH02_003903 [Chlamydomonas schloesseri]|uniref:Protein kinase domain-containing protein n=1 Tax=Chlamydomonas schloesseri TaxID=2026947 RepID=A0A836B8Z2_9CHLO|nr:hypothetical protein HYH02_003903 [Chlamydomonas schloesseri]|eukprot:KAG2451297.1 hypothetical protein HYH02_003903 [Chlamydomonas schloesseri]